MQLLVSLKVHDSNLKWVLSGACSQTFPEMGKGFLHIFYYEELDLFRITAYG